MGLRGVGEVSVGVWSAVYWNTEILEYWSTENGNDRDRSPERLQHWSTTVLEH